MAVLLNRLIYRVAMVTGYHGNTGVHVAALLNRVIYRVAIVTGYHGNTGVHVAALLNRLIYRVVIVTGYYGNTGGSRGSSPEQSDLQSCYCNWLT